MKLKKFISSVLALSTIVTSLSAVNVFAADPTFTVGTPVDALTGEEVTEFTAGQIIELPIDVKTDSEMIANLHVEVYYDTNMLQAGVYAPSRGATGDALTYLNKYGNVYFARCSRDSSYIIGRKNLLYADDAGTFSGNRESVEQADKALLGWTITGANPQYLNYNEEPAEFYMVFTVKDNFDASELQLNAGTNSLNSDGIFGVEAEIAETVGTAADRVGEQNDYKVNACDGAFKIVVDSTELPYWVQGVKVKINDVEYPLDACVQDATTTIYNFPVRVTSAADEASVSAEIIALVSKEAWDVENTSEVSWGTVNVDMSGTATGYTAYNDALDAE